MEEIDELPGHETPQGLTPSGLKTQGSESMRIPIGAIESIGGASLRIPDARKASDIDWLLHVHRLFPRLGDANGWNARFGRELNATDDRDSFGSTGLPVLDGKHIAPFAVLAEESPRRIDPEVAARLLPDRRFTRERLAYRDVSASTNRLALIAAIIPANVVTTYTLFCLRTAASHQQQDFLCALFNSGTMNAIVRMLMGGHVTTALIESLPVPKWTGDDRQLRIAALGKRLAEAPLDVAAKEELDREVEQIYGAGRRSRSPESLVL